MPDLRMQGFRLDDGVFADDPFKPGSYGRVLVQGEWKWRGCVPVGMAVNLAAHEVVENDDGTITVSPSILVSDGTGRSWHGYLEAGVWREV